MHSKVRAFPKERALHSPQTGVLGAEKLYISCKAHLLQRAEKEGRAGGDLASETAHFRKEPIQNGNQSFGYHLPKHLPDFLGTGISSSGALRQG